MNYPLLIARNLRRNFRRSFLTLLGILISFLLFVAIFTLLDAFNKFLKTENSKVNLFFRPVYMGNFVDAQLPEAYLHELARLPMVQHLTPYKVYLGTGIRDEINVFVLGVYPEHIAWLRNLGKSVTSAQLERFQGEKKAALVGEELMKQNHWSVGQEATIRGIGGLKDLPVRIVGVMDRKADLPDIVMVRYDYLKDHMGGNGKFSLALLRAENPYQVPWLIEAIREQFQNSFIPVEVITEKGFIESILGELASISDAIRMIAWVALLATLFVVGNTMAMSIRERSVDQGVLRTLGFSRGKVFFIYLAEAMILTVAGGLLGGLLGCFIFEHFEIVLYGSAGAGDGRRESLLVSAQWALMKEVFLFSLLMGFLSGFPPAYFAVRKKITETLRFTA